MVKDNETMEKSKSEKPAGAAVETAPVKSGGPAVATAGATPATGTAAPETTGRRPPGQKEVIPLVWKLVGTSAGMPVTLLKCVERADAEAQMARLAAERFYQDLAIHSIDAEVPVSAKMAKTRRDAIAAALREASERAKAKNDRKSSAASKGARPKTADVKVAKAKPKANTKTKTKTVAKTKTAKKPKVATKKKAASKTKAKAKTKTKASSTTPSKAKSRTASKTAKKRTTSKATKTTGKAVKKAKTKSSKRAAR